MSWGFDNAIGFPSGHFRPKTAATCTLKGAIISDMGGEQGHLNIETEASTANEMCPLICPSP